MKTKRTNILLLIVGVLFICLLSPNVSFAREVRSKDTGELVRITPDAGTQPTVVFDHYNQYGVPIYALDFGIDSYSGDSGDSYITFKYYTNNPNIVLKQDVINNTTLYSRKTSYMQDNIYIDTISLGNSDSATSTDKSYSLGANRTFIDDTFTTGLPTIKGSNFDTYAGTTVNIYIAFNHSLDVKYYDSDENDLTDAYSGERREYNTDYGKSLPPTTVNEIYSSQIGASLDIPNTRLPNNESRIKPGYVPVGFYSDATLNNQITNLNKNIYDSSINALKIYVKYEQLPPLELTLNYYTDDGNGNNTLYKTETKTFNRADYTGDSLYVNVFAKNYYLDDDEYLNTWYYITQLEKQSNSNSYRMYQLTNGAHFDYIYHAKAVSFYAVFPEATNQINGFDLKGGLYTYVKKPYSYSLDGKKNHIIPISDLLFVNNSYNLSSLPSSASRSSQQGEVIDAIYAAYDFDGLFFDASLNNKFDVGDLSSIKLDPSLLSKFTKVCNDDGYSIYLFIRPKLKELPITYHLFDGEFEDQNNISTTYTIETDLALGLSQQSKPHKEGYVFVKWWYWYGKKDSNSPFEYMYPVYYNSFTNKDESSSMAAVDLYAEYEKFDDLSVDLTMKYISPTNNVLGTVENSQKEVRVSDLNNQEINAYQLYDINQLKEASNNALDELKYKQQEVPLSPQIILKANAARGNRNIVLYVPLAAQTYNIIYKDKDDNVITTISFSTDENETYTPTVPEGTNKENYTVEGIYGDKDFSTSASSFNKSEATGDVVYYIKYTPNPIKVLVISADADENSQSFEEEVTQQPTIEQNDSRLPIDIYQTLDTNSVNKSNVVNITGYFIKGNKDTIYKEIDNDFIYQHAGQNIILVPTYTLPQAEVYFILQDSNTNWLNDGSQHKTIIAKDPKSKEDTIYTFTPSDFDGYVKPGSSVKWSDIYYFDVAEGKNSYIMYGDGIKGGKTDEHGYYLDSDSIYKATSGEINLYLSVIIKPIEVYYKNIANGETVTSETFTPDNLETIYTPINASYLGTTGYNCGGVYNTSDKTQQATVFNINDFVDASMPNIAKTYFVEMIPISTTFSYMDVNKSPRSFTENIVQKYDDDQYQLPMESNRVKKINGYYVDGDNAQILYTYINNSFVTMYQGKTVRLIPSIEEFSTNVTVIPISEIIQPSQTTPSQTTYTYNDSGVTYQLDLTKPGCIKTFNGYKVVDGAEDSTIYTQIDNDFIVKYQGKDITLSPIYTVYSAIVDTYLIYPKGDSYQLIKTDNGKTVTSLDVVRNENGFAASLLNNDYYYFINRFNLTDKWYVAYNQDGTVNDTYLLNKIGTKNDPSAEVYQLRINNVINFDGETIRIYTPGTPKTFDIEYVFENITLDSDLKNDPLRITTIVKGQNYYDTFRNIAPQTYIYGDTVVFTSTMFDTSKAPYQYISSISGAINQNTYGDVRVTVSFSPIVYKINYVLNGNDVTQQVASFDEIITGYTYKDIFINRITYVPLTEQMIRFCPIKEGNYVTWIIDGQDISVLNNMMGDVTYVATYTPVTILLDPFDKDEKILTEDYDKYYRIYTYNENGAYDPLPDYTSNDVYEMTGYKLVYLKLISANKYEDYTFTVNSITNDLFEQLNNITYNNNFFSMNMIPLCKVREYDINYVADVPILHTNRKSFAKSDSTFSLSNATSQGYSFNGWYSDKTYTTPLSDIDPAKYNQPISIYAKFTKNMFGGNPVITLEDNNPHVEITDKNGNPLEEGKDYNVSYDENTGKVIVTGSGDYSYADKIEKTFDVVKIPEKQQDNTNPETKPIDGAQTITKPADDTKKDAGVIESHTQSAQSGTPVQSETNSSTTDESKNPLTKNDKLPQTSDISYSLSVVWGLLLITLGMKGRKEIG